MDNCLLRYKEAGFCDELKGIVHLHFVFVNDCYSIWTSKACQELDKTIEKLSGLLTEQAAKDNVPLRILVEKETFSVLMEVGAGNDRNMIEAYAKKHGGTSLKSLHTKMQSATGVDRNVFLFLLNKEGRAYAHPTEYKESAKSADEYAVVFQPTLHSMLHELLHLFGAVDYYYPELIRKEAGRLFPDSVMLSDETSIDDLTRYLIGWKKVLSPNAKTLFSLGETISKEELNKALSGQWNTDYAVFYYDDCIYSGPMKNGLREGMGKLEYYNGAYYEGGFLKGYRFGYGKLKNARGDLYEGEFFHGKKSGQGILKYANGNVYEGDFSQDKPNGRGILRYADGDVYEGEVMDACPHGEGKIKFHDGNAYQGEFFGGFPHGKGRIQYADGSDYEGEVFHGAPHGKGISHYANGYVYEGEFFAAKPHGQGEFRRANGRVKYRGKFVDGIYKWFGLF